MRILPDLDNRINDMYIAEKDVAMHKKLTLVVGFTKSPTVEIVGDRDSILRIERNLKLGITDGEDFS